MLHSKMVCHRLWQMVLCTSVTTIAPLGYPAAIAQITPDGTLGSESAIVAPTDNVRGLPGTLIRGGARRGVNLFQSFSDFNVGNGQRVYFANPAGVESILSRVTGANPSNILGTLGVDGPANLFLLNPKGILFGPNARLDVAGSFVASTSDRFDFGNGMSFSATHPEAAPLLTMSLRPGLQYGTNYQGDLVNAGNLAVGAGQTLALAGRNVTMTGSLATPGGTVQVLGDRLILRDNASIDVSSTAGGGNVLIGGDLQGQGPLPTASYTYIGPNVTINASTTSSLIPANGGRVIVWSDDTTRFYGTINARGAETGGDGGFVEVSGRQNLVFNGRVDASAPNGRPGTLLLDPTNIEIVAAGTGNGTLADVDDPNDPNRGVNGTQIGVDLINNATANVLLQATNNITFSAPINIPNEGIGLNAQAGNSIFVNNNIFTWGGDVTLAARSGDVTINGVTIDTNRPFIGFAGDVNITAGRLVAINGSTLDARSDSPGSSDFATVRISGTDVRVSRSTITASNIGGGLAGDIFIDAPNQIEILNSSIFSQGDFGRILLGISRGSELNSLQTTPLPTTIRITDSRIATNNLGDTNRGSIGIFSLDQVSITASNLSSTSNNTNTDNFSKIEIFARNGSVSLNQSFISTTNRGEGFAGDVVITALDQLDITNSEIFSRGNQGRVLLGRANDFGNFDPNRDYAAFSPQTLTINNSLINTNNSSVESGGVSAGVISLRAIGDISLLNNTRISSSSDRRGNAGDVILQTNGDITLRDSDIQSNLEAGGIGRSGEVNIEARSLFLLTSRDSRIGAQIQTLVRQADDGSPPGEGNAGDIIINTRETVRLIGRNSIGRRSAIFSSVGEGVAGNSGNVFVTTDSVHVRNGGGISVDNEGLGRAGNVFVGARGIWLDNFGFISAESSSGLGGNIFVDTLALVLGRNSNISATAGINGAGGNGGNIAIGTGNVLEFNAINPAGRLISGFRFDQRSFIVAGKTFRDNNILAEARTGTGGNIRISTARLFDIAERSEDFVVTNDISSRSSFGTDGTVLVDTFDLFPSLRTDPLPERYEAPRISEGCDPRVRQETSQFTITGRGGLPADPTEVLSPDTLATSGTAPAATTPPPTTAEVPTINPARGWVKNADGSVRLVAYATDPAAPVPVYPLWSTPSSCYAP